MTLQQHQVLATLSGGYPRRGGRLVTRYSPVRRFTPAPKGSFSLDLHVLGAPLAFILSRDHTLSVKLRCDGAFGYAPHLSKTDPPLVDKFQYNTPASACQVGGENLVEPRGLEPLTSCMPYRRSPN